jgi:hypothetical protein
MMTDRLAAQLFQAFATHPDLFALKPATYAKAAIDVIATQLKDKGCNLEMARRIVRVVGREPVLAALDEQSSTFIEGLVNKFDKANSNRAKAEGSWTRTHLAALVEGRVEPEVAPAKVKRTPAPKKLKKAEVQRALQLSRAMSGD